MDAFVVDDSKMMRVVLARALREVGFSVVHEACNGKDALALLARIVCPSLALIDWNMPEIDGLQLVRAIRERNEYKSMRILIVSTEGVAGNRLAAVEAGADGYQTKPFSPDAIRAAIDTLGMRVSP